MEGKESGETWELPIDRPRLTLVSETGFNEPKNLIILILSTNVTFPLLEDRLAAQHHWVIILLSVHDIQEVSKTIINKRDG
jgi:hypothetical protein